jgi:hypothetical protein
MVMDELAKIRHCCDELQAVVGPMSVQVSIVEKLLREYTEYSSAPNKKKKQDDMPANCNGI